MFTQFVDCYGLQFFASMCNPQMLVLFFSAQDTAQFINSGVVVVDNKERFCMLPFEFTPNITLRV